MDEPPWCRQPALECGHAHGGGPFKGSIADLLEAPPIDLRARGFRRASRARTAWDKPISEDVVWRIWIDGDRYSSIAASGLSPSKRSAARSIWRRRFPKTPWKVPTLHVNVHDEDVVGILFGPVGTGNGEAWLGPGPAYFDDTATYDVGGTAEGLAA